MPPVAPEAFAPLFEMVPLFVNVPLQSSLKLLVFSVMPASTVAPSFVNRSSLRV